MYFNAMKEVMITAIVNEVFKKAKEESASHTKYALATHLSERTEISSKTFERLCNQYVIKDGSSTNTRAANIDLLCNYLGYEGYQDYVEKNSEKEGPQSKGTNSENNDSFLEKEIPNVGKAHLDIKKVKLSRIKWLTLILGLVLGIGIVFVPEVWSFRS